MIEFEWDQNNIKHVCDDYPERGNTVFGVESVFYDPDFLVTSKRLIRGELRYYAVGVNSLEMVKAVVYTISGTKVRPISCWPANKQTKRYYYENRKN
ncbi:BrnT family toxin [Dyadobacter luticola]|uniref:BrnT family toxin n=1 Tax=Dyadobacter luticola TaxID=1979387 RepID=A0A5R9KQ22_9BACT|nr:BrnT family toxin [Dyadobacter luticola]